MLIIIGEHIPKRIRGVLQLWLLEVRPNVFIGSVNKIIENRIIKFINPYLNMNTDIMIIRKGNKQSIQGIDITYACNSNNKLCNINGLQLIQQISK